jgi:hypothetical protein
MFFSIKEAELGLRRWRSFWRGQRGTVRIVSRSMKAAAGRCMDVFEELINAFWNQRWRLP